jgi:hypothetical protein
MEIKMKSLQKQITTLTAISIMTIGAAVNHAHAEHVHARPDSHAPIGVMGDHVMDEGEFMLSYRYMEMQMDGNRTGTNRVSTPLPGFMVSPLSMDMKMHMLGAMYAPSKKLTLSLMVPVLEISMDHRINMNGVEFTTESDGIGDITLAGVYQLSQSDGGNLLFNLGLNVPTGSIDEKDELPVSMGVPVQLPYPMQTGSGTYDVTPGLTYTMLYSQWSWGAQGLYTYRISDNDNGYTLGNKFNASIWAAKMLTHSISVSARLNALDWGNVDGADTTLAAMPTVPTKNPELRGGSRVDALLGVNYVAHSLNHLRLAFEVGAPVYQDLNGPQLETDLVFTLGAQYTF